MPSKSHSIQLTRVFCIIAPSFILYGYNQSGFSSLLDLPDVIHHFPREATDSTLQGITNACLQLGALLGALSCSVIGDALGRRRTLLVAAVLATIGQAFQCSAFAFAQLIVGRVVLGVGIGQMSVTAPVWQSESSAAGNRGRQVIAAGIFICVGFALSSWIDFAFTKVSSPPLQWRIPLAIPTVFSLVVIFTVFAIPESPRWLVQKGRISQAMDVLAVLRGLPRDDPEIRSECDRIECSLEEAKGSSLKDILDPNDRTRLGYRFALCVMLQFAQQMTGGNLISIYTTTIFKSNLHLQGDLPRILAATSLTWKFLCSFIAFAAVDRLGRRTLFVVSATGMSVCMIVIAVVCSFPAENHAASYVAAVFIFLFNFCYPIGFLGGNFLYCTEVAPIRLRVAITSISTANHWLWNFFVAMVTPVALDTIGWRYYIVFAAINACVPVCVLLFFPETMNRNLEVIDGVFKDAPTIWDIVPMARRAPQGDIQIMHGDFGDEKEDECASDDRREYADGQKTH